MVLRGSKIEDVKYVSSHPMALLQCKRFFKKHPHLTLVEEKDTAEVAKRISENNVIMYQEFHKIAMMFFFKIFNSKY